MIDVRCFPIKVCRSCGGSDITPILSFSPTALCESYSTEPSEDDCYPLELSLCSICCLVQASHVIPESEIFRHYYQNAPSISRDSRYVDDYVADVIFRWNGKSNPFVVQIGSHDGGLLVSFKESGCRVLGVESNRWLAQIGVSQGIETKPVHFGSTVSRTLIEEYGHADVVLIDNSFGGQHPDHLANIQNPATYAAAVSELLGEDGLLAVQTNDIKKMLNGGIFDLFYHEHCSYFSQNSICKLFVSVGLGLVDVDTMDKNSTASRFFFKKLIRPESKANNSKIVENHDEYRADLLCQLKAYETFRVQVAKKKISLLSELDKYAGRHIVGYGASASSTTLIYEFGLADYLDYLVDDNPNRVGTYSPGWNLPVKAVDVLYQGEIDLILILAWRHAKIIKRKHPTLQSKMLVANEASAYHS